MTTPHAHSQEFHESNVSRAVGTESRRNSSCLNAQVFQKQAKDVA